MGKKHFNSDNTGECFGQCVVLAEDGLSVAVGAPRYQEESIYKCGVRLIDDL